MQKVYLLLRSNKQTGPYTIDELLELNLKPLDLVWVEGKSFGWSYPSEIESLKAFVDAPAEENTQIIPPFSNNYDQADLNASHAVTNKIFVSMPANASNITTSNSKPSINISRAKAEEVKQGNQHATSPLDTEYDHKALEIKAEEIKQRAQAFASASPHKKPEDVVEIKYAKSLEEVEEEYTSWMYKSKTKKKKNFSKEQLVSVLAVIAVIAGGWFLGSGLFNSVNQKEDHVVHVQNAVREEISPVITETSVDETLRYDINDNNEMITTLVSKPEQEKKILLEKSIVERPETNVAIAPIEEYNSIESYEKPIVKNSEELVAEVEQPKKKTLGESVSNVFRKLIKDEEADSKTGNGERKSNRRGELSTSEIDISDQVDIKMNHNSESWMMGVIGLKLTLSNKSSLPLKTAVIDVLYFNDQDKLLDKKRITFSNIAPKKSQTISAPDHRLADRAEIKIVSATGIEDAYAKN
jgi:hypothetical protein